MLEKEVRNNILKILYEDLSSFYTCDKIVELIPGTSSKQVERTLRNLKSDGYLETLTMFTQGGGIVGGLTSKAVEYYEDHCLSDESNTLTNVNRPSMSINKNVFIVHGHDGEMKAEVARLLKDLGLEPIILSEQPNGGRTIIEKFEDHSQQVGYAIVLMSDKDDVGRSVEDSELKPRARQNVILELGYFIGQLGRKRVCVLKKSGVEDPSDIFGIVYTPYVSGSKEWQYAVARELKEAGYEVDLGRV